MVKLVDMPDLGSGAARRVGSSPIIRTEINYKTLITNVLRVFLFSIFPVFFPKYNFTMFFQNNHLINLRTLIEIIPSRMILSKFCKLRKLKHHIPSLTFFYHTHEEHILI
jgi:hypothetical protein